MIALVACCAAIFWAWRVWWDQEHPLQAAARGLGSWDATRRVEAVREVSGLGFGQARRTVRLLMPSLKDRDPRVRAATAGSLGVLASNAVASGTDADDARAMTASLLELMKDPEGPVRAAAGTSLGMILQAGIPPSGRGSAPAAEGGCLGRGYRRGGRCPGRCPG